MAELPKSIRIGCHRFKVEYDKTMAERGANGETYVDKLKMLVRLDLEGTKLQEVVLHETLHAVWHQTGLATEGSDTAELEEAIVTSIATPLLEAIRANPKLVEFLTAKE